MKTRREWLATSLAAGLAALPWGARAQWPTRAVRFVVPFVPGGTSDIVARTTANELTRLLGSPVVIDNKSGGGGVPAVQEVARAPADGHTLILGHVGSLAVNPYIFRNTGYDVNRDFAPVTLLAKVPTRQAGDGAVVTAHLAHANRKRQQFCWHREVP